MSKNGKKIRIFSALEVANICGVVNQTAINWIKNQHLKAFTTPGGQYRIYAEDLLEFLESRGMRIPDELIELTRDSERRTILIVDDDRDLNSMLREILVRKLPEYEVVQAFDGFEAGRLLAENNPVCVVLDIDLPGIDGHKLCAKIKEDPKLHNPLVISISGLDPEKDGKQIVEEGADAFFPKPLDFDALVEAITDKLH
ncbi:histidine kinase [Marispirochaeta aestuarii]|uniref:Histidine kinase n=1 Tax=Marispirochaeta aestuarii TaxID=1963862 RepID=A0A1Y1S243_9SPIO|nr:response regulator [Marispirochaeta aestuarii]ORC37856.1 histidine kinase [Marispirochaeta aestuarii]